MTFYINKGVSSYTLIIQWGIFGLFATKSEMFFRD